LIEFNRWDTLGNNLDTVRLTNNFTRLLQVPRTRLVLNTSPIDRRKREVSLKTWYVGAPYPRWKIPIFIVTRRFTFALACLHPLFPYPLFRCSLPSSRSDLSIADRSNPRVFFSSRAGRVAGARRNESCRDISSPGTMACEFFKVSLYFFIYDRWSVSEREKAPCCEYNTSVITSKMVLHAEIYEILRIFRM